MVRVYRGDGGMRGLTCFRVTSGSHSVLRTTFARSTCLALDHWLCSRRRASSELTPSRSVILVTAWKGQTRGDKRVEEQPQRVRAFGGLWTKARLWRPLAASRGTATASPDVNLMEKYC